MRWLWLSIVVMLGVNKAEAWNALGHRTIAEIAWRQMDARERAEAAALLKHHPHYDLILSANVPAGVDTNEWVFLTAAVWPDMVRPAKKGEPAKPEFVTRYNVIPHAIDLPLVRESEKRVLSIKKFKVPEPNVQSGLIESLATLRNKHASLEDRAVSLAWVLHLCGDLHQPLHAATLLTVDHPQGNGAGGVFQVLDPQGNQTSIHTFWDALPGKDLSYASVTRLANELTATPDLQPASMREYRKHKHVKEWVKESYEMAANFGYAEDRVQFVHNADLKSGKVSTNDLPKISDEYAREAHELAKVRWVLAGQRLADQLKKVW
jgi:hypothetical protein